MKKYPFDQAAEKAGQLYGNLLGRVADKSGYDFVVSQLNTGESSIKNIVINMLTSDEFREKFVINNTPNELAKLLHIVLLKELRPRPEAIKNTAINLLEDDWRRVIINMIQSEAYSKAFGEEKIPVIKYS
ncbi:DUF4214 domain-containing protein [Nitrosomonas sp. Is37]|uniref:DUF4214 domain-containing protein n=1 Tax=Nitrosomonas sp. Is37 TaxID=3080535 RepID=UPI00294AE927|nr:phycobilisome rod-core linker polypeptide [Nitrosomonas sp. Is37]MDV6344904.1 phycobilisome rod-core linker polypeptide [Nitrosomonas sp. Is37]